MEHAKFVGHQTAASDPHVHSARVCSDNFLDGCESSGAVFHARRHARWQAGIDVNRPGLKMVRVKFGGSLRFLDGAVSVAPVKRFKCVQVVRLALNSSRPFTRLFAQTDGGSGNPSGGGCVRAPVVFPLSDGSFLRTFFAAAVDHLVGRHHVPLACRRLAVANRFGPPAVVLCSDLRRLEGVHRLGGFDDLRVGLVVQKSACGRFHVVAGLDDRSSGLLHLPRPGGVLHTGCIRFGMRN